jgi:putative ABC transport system ATP-binding protein
MNAVVRALGVGKTYAGFDAQPVHALQDVSFEIERGEMVALRGPSGCGKSTLLALLACADRPTSGTIELDGARADTLSARALRRLRRRSVGVVFQGFHLLDALTVRENVALPLALLGRGRRETTERVTRVLERVALAEKSDAYPPKLSGGQAQRVAIARALVHEPAIVLADEPTGNLDSHTGALVIELFREVAAHGQTILIATHDEAVAAACDRTIALEDGRRR